MSNGDKSYKEVRAKVGEDKDGKAYYKTIGRVLETKAGPMLKLDMIPLMWEGWAYLSTPLDKEEGQTHGEMKRKVARTTDLDDSAPF